MALTQTQVSQLYVSIFNRASEGEGNTFWQTAGTMAEVANDMLATDDAKQYFGSSLDSNQAFIEHIYLNTFNKKPADDVDGIKFWVDALNSGIYSKGEIVASLVASVADYSSSTDPDEKAAYDQFINRVEVSNYMAREVEKAPADYATSTKFATSGTTGLVVTSDASTVTTAEASVDALKPVPGQTFTLTTGVDTFVGTTGDDTFNGTLTTVGNLDSLDGKAGKDIANLEVSQDISSTFTTTDVETINLTTYGNRNVDMTKMTGVETFNVKNSTGTVTITNADSATMALSFEGSSTNDIKAGYKAGTLSGTADKLAVSLNTASAVNVETDAGFESAEITVNGKSDIDKFIAPGVTTVALKGSGNLDIANGQMTGIETLSAADYTGSLTTGTADATTGFVPADAITGSANGTVITLGSGTDNISVKDVSAATKSTTVKLGAGDDKVTVNAAGNAIYVFGEAGNDSINAVTTALDSADVINGGEGTDTLTLDGSKANNAMVLKSIENVTVTGTGATQTFTNDDSATAITWKTDASAVALADLSAGSTVKVETATGATTSTAANVTVGFKAQEASSTIDIASGMTGALTLDNITAATVNLGAASAMIASSITATSDVTDLTINATGAVTTTGAVASTDNKLEKVTITGSDVVTTGAMTSTGLTDVSVTGSKAVTIGTLVTATKLDSVSLTSSTDTITAAVIGAAAGTAVLDVTMTAAKNITQTGNIDSTKIGNISATSTAGTVTLGTTGVIGATATTMGDVTITAKTDAITTTIGTTANLATLGTVSLTATDGKAQFTAIDAKDTGGITVNASAKTTIDSDGSGTKATVTNTGGAITATLAGAATAVVDYDGKVVNLTATNTGGLTSTITNAATAGDGSTSTISLGNATSLANTITIDGIVDTINVTGGTGTDTVKFGMTDAIKNGTFSLGGGSSDSIDFSGLAIAGTKGLAMNFSSSTIYFGEGSANVSSIASGKVAAYDAANYAGSTTAANKAIIVDGQNFTVSGVEIVTGTDVADYIAVANTGMTVTGGKGADIIIANAGVDIIKGLDVADQSIASTAQSIADSGAKKLAANDTITFGNGVDIVKNFTSGTDKLDGTAVNTAPTTLIGEDTTAALTSGTAYVAYGTFVESTGVFNIAAAFDAATAKDALVVEGDGTQTFVNEQDFILLTGLNQALVAADFI